MNELPVLIELQSVHDNLRVIQRDLSAFPPDLAALDAELKTLAKKSDDTAKGLAATQSLLTGLSGELAAAQRSEDLARTAVKAASQKAQYAAAIREHEERQRHTAAVNRPVKEAQTRLETLERQAQEVATRQAEVQKRFDELMEVFLSEHGNQVEARGILEARRQELESGLAASLRTKFGRLLQQRAGRAVVPVENGACGGCRTRLRTPFLAQLRDAGTLFCESCQRIVYDPAAKS